MLSMFVSTQGQMLQVKYMMPRIQAESIHCDFYHVYVGMQFALWPKNEEYL